MNSYQRYVRMLEGQPVDFVPRIPILMHYAAHHSNITYADFARDYRQFTQTKLRMMHEYGFEQLDLMSDPWRETTAFGGQIEYLETTVPKCSPPLMNAKILENLASPDLNTSERIVNALKIIDEFKAKTWQQYSITGWVEGPAAEAADLRGVENFMIDLIDDPLYACELMDRCIGFAIKFAQAQIEHGCDTIGIGDAIASQLSPKLYESYILPKEMELVKKIKQAGAYVRLHICGNIAPTLEFIKDLDIDILDVDWMVDMEQARRIVGDQIALAGNLDPVRVILEGSPEDIYNGFCEIYKKVGNPYFVNAGCEIPRDTPRKNLQALCKPIPYIP